MADDIDGLKGAENRFQELKDEYRSRSAAFLEICSKKSKIDDRRIAFWAWHNAGVDFFNSFERVLTVGAREKADREPVWFTDKGETAINLLETIATHYETAAIKAPDLRIPNAPPKPSRTAFAGIQRIARTTNSKLAYEWRDRFVKLDLPTHGFDTDESAKATETPLEPRFFYVGCGLILFAIVMGVWGFSKGDLTPDQRSILLWCLPLASGFGCWTFAGSLSAKARGWQGIAVSATGGFGVWFLTHFMLFRQ